MKAYLITTGSIFGLIVFMHLLRSIAEWHLLTTDPWSFLAMAALGIVAAALSAWAWRLLKVSADLKRAIKVGENDTA